MENKRKLYGADFKLKVALEAIKERQTMSELMAFTEVLTGRQISISMDGRGRALDNVFIERLWRSVKYEYVYLHAPSNAKELWQGIHNYFTRYNYHRPHQSLDYLTPAQVYFQDKEKVQNQ